MAKEKLSARKVATARKRGRYNDGGGLWLQVSKWRTKSWVFQFTAPSGRIRQMGLGAIDGPETVSLAEARAAAELARKQVKAGIDPIEARAAERAGKRLEQATRLTFQECAQQYLAAHGSSWRNAKHRDQWASTLTTYANPLLGELPVAAVDTSLVLKVLKPIWDQRPETASRLRGRIEKVLDYAKAQGARSGENPARWKGHLDHLLPARSKVRRVAHHPALPFTEVAGFTAELRTREGISARALAVTILTALRTSEVIGATWNEIDRAERTWTIPAERIKGGKAHRVPLSDEVVTLLTALPREAGSEFVFIGGKTGRPLSNMAMLELVREMRPGLTVHGFRSTFRDWASETTHHPNHVVEQALAHVIGNAVEAAYRRGDLFHKRRQLMDEWAHYCYRPPLPASVTPIRGSA